MEASEQPESAAPKLGPALWSLAAVAGLVVFAAWNPPVRYALSNLQPMGMALLLMAACIGLGLAARIEDPITAAAVGIGIFGGLQFAASALQILSVWFTVAVLAAGLVFFVLAVLRLRPWKKWRFPSLRWPTALGWAILAITFAAILPFVLAPDVSTDSLEYHLLIPRLYLEHGGITFVPLFVESNYPNLLEYLFIGALQLGDDLTAKSFHFLCGLLVLGVIARLVQRIQPEAPGVLGAALFFSMPVVALTSGWAWNDLTFTLFVLLALLHLMDGRLLLAGTLFGLATWTKYTFVLIVIALAVVLVRGLVKRWWSTRQVVAFVVPVLLISAIWMTKNAVLTGNPVYPFLNSLFQSPHWDPAADRFFRGTLTRFEFTEWSWWTYLAAPFLMTLKPRVMDVHTGPLLLLLLPLAFVKGGGRAAEILRTYAIGITMGWLLIHTEARSLLSLFACLSALYASVIPRLSRFASRAVAVLIPAGTALTLIVLLVSTNVVTDPARYFLGLETREEYVERADPNQAAYRWLNANPRVGGVLLVGLHDPYHLKKPALFSSCCDKPVAQQMVERHGSADALAAALKRGGVTHLAVLPSEYTRDNLDKLYSWSDEQREVFRELLRSNVRVVARVADVVIYEVR